MRVIVLLSIIVTVLLGIYRYRYKLLNIILTITVLRKLVVRFCMYIKTVRKNILPNVFTTEIK